MIIKHEEIQYCKQQKKSIKTETEKKNQSFFFPVLQFLLLDRLQFFIVKHKFNNVLLPKKTLCV